MIGLREIELIPRDAIEFPKAVLDVPD